MTLLNAARTLTTMKESEAFRPPTIDPLIRRIARRGWTEDLARRFEQRYGNKVRWLIVVHMEKLGLLQGRIAPSHVERLSSRRLQLYENTLSDLWVALLDRMVSEYVEKATSGKVQRAFIPYLSGVIRHLVLANARTIGLIGRETPAEIIRGICEAKQEKTRTARTAWAKYCFDHTVRLALLTVCPSDRFAAVYGSVHHVVDYFFERFIPSQCTVIASLTGRVLDGLVDRFVTAETPWEEATAYVGIITPYAAAADVSTGTPATISDDEYLSALHQRSQQRWL